MPAQLLKHFIKIIVPIIVLSACGDKSSSTTRAYTYIGGEIVNPNVDYVILFSEKGIGDTVKLDQNNRFLYKVKNLKDGIYSFKHNPENQLILLEQGDSLLFRLNTFEFDESLVFSGDGARRNNFLIESFLKNEEERNAMQKRGYRESPSDFQKYQDSIYKIRLYQYYKLTEKTELSDISKKILKASFDYDYYSRFELYHYRHYGVTDLDTVNDLPQNFFDYRKEVDFNDKDLKRLYSYNRFLNNYITNSAYVNHAKGNSYYLDPVGNTTYKLNLIDSLIHNPYIKKNMLRGITARFLLDSRNEELSNTVLEYYLKVSKNKTSQKDMVTLAKATNKLKPGNSISDQTLITPKDEELKITALLNKPVTALYFWSMDDIKHFIKAHKTAFYLSKTYPDINFIAINIDDEETKKWQRTIKRYNYDPLTEYEFKHPDRAAKELVLYNKQRVILLDRSGKILDAQTNLFSPVFEAQLINALRKQLYQKEKATP